MGNGEKGDDEFDISTAPTLTHDDGTSPSNKVKRIEWCQPCLFSRPEYLSILIVVIKRVRKHAFGRLLVFRFHEPGELFCADSWR